jgi:hypothetical protein
LFFWGPRTNRYVLVTLALAIVTGAGLLTTIVWTAITGLRLGAFICLIVTAVLAVIATALFERRSVTADRALAAEHFSTTTSRRSGPGGERVGAAGLAPGQARVAGRGTRGQRPPCGQGRHVPPPSAIWRPGSSCITALRLRSLSHHGNDPAMRSMTYTAPVLGVLAGVVGIADTIPYVRDTIRGSTRPHRGTWLIWSVLAIVVFLSQRADGATWSLIMAAAQPARPQAPSSCSRSAAARGPQPGRRAHAPLLARRDRMDRRRRASSPPHYVVAADLIGRR